MSLIRALNFFNLAIAVSLAYPGRSDHLNEVLFSGCYELVELSYSFDNDTIYWPTAKTFRFTKQVEEINGMYGPCFSVANTISKSLNNVLFNNYVIFDLTHSFNSNTIYWPDSEVFKFTKKIEEKDTNGSWYASNDFAAGEHGGTHIDAPYHFFKDGLRVGEIPLEKLIVTLIIVDVSSMVNDDPNFVLHKHHLDNVLYFDINKPSVLIFKFGWSKYFNDRNRYLGVNDYDGSLNFPSLSGEIAEWITTSYKSVVGIGVDVASVDPGSSDSFPVHKITSKAGLYSMENVNLNQHIPETGCTALVMPMKIAMGTGAPLRLVAICPKQTPNKF